MGLWRPLKIFVLLLCVLSQAANPWTSLSPNPLVGASTSLHIAAQGALIQYAPSIQALVEDAGYQASSMSFLSDQQMVEDILNYNLSISGGALFQCMQLATHQTKAMNLIVTTDPATGVPIQYSAGAILTLDTREDIDNITDLRAKSVGAGQPTQIATFLSQWFALDQAGLNLFADVARIVIVENSTSLIPMLRANKFDVIFVSALQLRPQALEGLKVINAIIDGVLPYPRSTSLYAGPLVSAIGNLSFITRKEISIQLLESEPNSSVELYGFTTPGDYSTVRNLMDGLGVIGPDFQCNYARDIAELIVCPSGFQKNSNPSCSSCEPNATCVCDACQEVHKLSTVSVILIAFSLSLLVTVLIASAVVYKVVKHRRSSQRLEALSNEAQDVFGPETAIKIMDWVGSGSSAEVYRGYWYNKEVAFKVGRNYRTSLEGELTTRLQHPNIVTTHACSQAQDNEQVWMITEFCSMGSLRAAIVGKLFDGDLAKVLQVLKQIAKALQYIHELGLVHGDLNCNNILLTRAAADSSHLIVKVADFEHARYSGSHTDTLGTISHLAPESFKGSTRHSSQDIYAFGIIMWELCHRCIYQIASSDIYDIIAGKRPAVASDVPQALAQLMQKCWAEDSANRPSTTAVLESITCAAEERSKGAIPL